MNTSMIIVNGESLISLTGLNIMNEFHICTFQESEKKQFGAGENALSGSGWLTGHHLIPDHCFYYTGGLRGRGDLAAFLIPDLKGKLYSEGSSPVILLSSNQQGAPTHNHQVAHGIFDPIENLAALKDTFQWTYGAAVEACVKSLKTFVNELVIRNTLKNYFEIGLGLTADSLLRAGNSGKTMGGIDDPTSSIYGKIKKKHTRSSPY
jgi:hypothetical protein